MTDEHWQQQQPTTGAYGPNAYAQPYPPAEPPRKRRHVFRWVFIAVQVIFLIWVIAGAASGNNTGDCHGLDAQTCKDAADAGTAIGVGLIIGLWIAVDVVLLLGRVVVLLGRRSK